MASVLDLVEKKSKELDNLARKNDKKSLLNEKKSKKIIQLSEESLTDTQKDVVKSNKSDLVESFADKFDIDSPRQKRKHKLQQIILKELGFQKSSGTPYLKSDVDGKERHPQGETHFESAEERLSIIKSSIDELVENAFDNFQSYYLWESFREKDRKEPIFSNPSHIGYHPDGVLLFELIIPSSSLDVIGARTEVAKNAVKNASNKALDEKVNYTIRANFRDPNKNDPISVVESHRDENGGMVLAEVVIPRTSYPVLGAKSNPVRINKNK